MTGALRFEARVRVLATGGTRTAPATMRSSSAVRMR